MKLNIGQSRKANALLDEIRAKLQALGAGDPELLFAYRRRVHIRLMQDERGTPAYRKKLKLEKWKQQDGRCAICHKEMPQAESERDRLHAPDGYTVENTQLVHHACHRQQQAERGFAKPRGQWRDRQPKTPR